MRRTRRLFLLAIIAILTGVGFTYSRRKQAELASAPPSPKNLPDNVNTSSEDWVYTKFDGKKKLVEIRAKDYRAVDKPSRHIELDQVDLRVFQKDGAQFDRVKSAHAVFDEADGALFADGEVEITLAVPADGSQGRLLGIRTSGVRFEPYGKASTARKAVFSFDLGEGEATGAVYDPVTRELELGSDVKLLWRGRVKGQTPMHIESGHLRYSEHDSKVYLSPHSRLLRGNLTLDAGESVVSLDKGNIQLVESKSASGVDKLTGRELAFGADDLRMEFGERSLISGIQGTGNARLDNASSTGRTETRTDRIDLTFAENGNDTILTTALASGRTQVKMTPPKTPTSGAASQKVLKSDIVLLKMRPNGEEIEWVETRSPGTLDLMAARAGQPDRYLQADRMQLQFADKNRLSNFHGTKVSTRTVKPATPQNKQPAPATTSSNEMIAAFHVDTGDATKIEQNGAFRYKEGDRQALADRASLDQAANKMHLEKGARVWDASGSVAGDTIDLNQQTGDFAAVGNVTSTRVQDRPQGKPNATGGMLAQDEPIQAKAARMTSSDENRRIVYEGGVVLWQSSNRLEADRVMLNRVDRTLRAEGNVVTQLVDKPPKNATPAVAAKAQRQSTVVRAATLDYADKDRLATYLGGVKLKRAEMDVTSSELRAYMSEEKEGSEDSGLEKAFMDGNVVILSVRPDRTRRGSAEHAEYFTREGKVVLKGGSPIVVDSVKGNMTGSELTYWTNNDSFEAVGDAQHPAQSRFPKK